MTRIDEIRERLSKVPEIGYLVTALSTLNGGDECVELLTRDIDYLLSQLKDGAEEPIPIILHCPRCGTQHIDAEEPETDYRHKMEAWVLVAEPQDRHPSRWTNPPHKSHLCHQCGSIWRPADVATNGVAAIQTRGKADTWTATAPTKTSARCGECVECGHKDQVGSDGFCRFTVMVDPCKGETDYCGCKCVPHLKQEPMKRCAKCGNLFRYPPFDKQASTDLCAYCREAPCYCKCHVQVTIRQQSCVHCEPKG